MYRLVPDMKLILASGSPRRREMLSTLGLVFEVLTTEVDEGLLDGELASEAAQRLATAKAESVSLNGAGTVVLAADTLVAVGGRILGKPQGEADALRMLRLLSDREHRVITGYCLKSADFREAGLAVTHVRFRALTLREMEAYVATGEPMDKAGAYAVQGLGAALVEEVNGSYSNVVGLPLAAVLEMMLRRGVIEPLVV